MKRFKHNLSKTKTLSCDMGELTPIGLTEVYPGDTIQQATNLLLRCSPLLAPVMHKVHVKIHHWFVPHRLVWDSWEDFITGGPDGTSAPTYPYIELAGGQAPGTLSDHLGVPPFGTIGQTKRVSALPFRGYSLIFNEWYRDQDLQTEVGLSKASGADAITNTGLLTVNWEKDYFTTSRPWAQKGPQVMIPLADPNPTVVRNANAGAWDVYTAGSNIGVTATDALHPGPGNANLNNSTVGVSLDPNGGLGVDLEAAQASINDLRVAFAIQRYEEARARFGSRYVEYLRYLGVRSSDARLQRPEYLGGGKQVVQFSEVLQTGTPDDADSPVGDMKGHGIAAARSNRYRRFFEEHGYVYTFLTVRPRTVYASGVERHWLYQTKEDFFQKELVHIGQQEVYQDEVYLAAGNTRDTVFGYNDRYSHLKQGFSGIAGDFRTTLNYWNMARIFSTAPALNDDFVACDPGKRNFAIQSEDTLWILANHSIQARRIIPNSSSSFVL